MGEQLFKDYKDMSDFRPKDILTTMRDTFSDIIPNIFSNGRPKVLNENLTSFMVISLPVMLYNKTYGKGYGMTTSYARIVIYVKDVNGVEHTAKLDSLAQSCMEKFPINTDLVIMSRPRIVMDGSDGYGFHTVTIQASLITK